MLIKMCLPKCDIYRKLKQTQNLDALIFPKKRFCLISGMKFSDVTLFLPDNLSGFKINIIFRPGLALLPKNVLYIII